MCRNSALSMIGLYSLFVVFGNFPISTPATRREAAHAKVNFYGIIIKKCNQI